MTALPCLNPMMCVFSITAGVAGRSLSAIPCLALPVPSCGAPSLAKLSPSRALSYTCRSCCEVAFRSSSASVAQHPQCHYRSESLQRSRSNQTLTQDRVRPSRPQHSKPSRAARPPFQAPPLACPPAAPCGRHLTTLPPTRRRHPTRWRRCRMRRVRKRVRRASSSSSTPGRRRILADHRARATSHNGRRGRGGHRGA